jgi:hypothetical protein
MAEQASSHSFDVPSGHPLIGIPVEENGHEVVRYFTDETEADKAFGSRKRRDVRHLAGVWKDLDWDAAADELDRIRHESKPTPPIDLGI